MRCDTGGKRQLSLLSFVENVLAMLLFGLIVTFFARDVHRTAEWSARSGGRRPSPGLGDMPTPWHTVRPDTRPGRLDER